MSQTRKRLQGPANAIASDPYALYEKAVQDPIVELGLLERALRRAGHPAKRLREDFSGTALLSAHWVAAGPGRSAVAVDIDPAAHAWGRAHHGPALGAASRRLHWVQADVRRGPTGPFDAVVALNFSYQVFHTRPALKDYLSGARRALAPGGVLMLDAFGGWLAQQGLVERRRLSRRATYLWEQGPLDPITHRVRCSIGFALSGGRPATAFQYDWRLWTLPELTDLLQEVGFADVATLWDVEPPGIVPRYVPRRRAVTQGAWLAYLVARRPLSSSPARPASAARWESSARSSKAARRRRTGPRRS